MEPFVTLKSGLSAEGGVGRENAAVQGVRGDRAGG